MGKDVQAMERQLRKLAGRMEKIRGERDSLIVRLHATRQLTLERIGEAAGITRGRVHQIIQEQAADRPAARPSSDP